MASSSMLLSREVAHRLKHTSCSSFCSRNNLLSALSLRRTINQPPCVFFSQQKHSSRAFREIDLDQLTMLRRRLITQLLQTLDISCSSNASRAIFLKRESKVQCRYRNRISSNSSLLKCCHYNLQQKPITLLSACSFSTASKYATLCDSKVRPRSVDLESQQKKDSSFTDNTNEAADKTKSILDKNPELRSIIEDIKRDFAKEQSKDEKKAKKPKKEANQRAEFSEVDNVEFDYSVAEDIEEYDYIDESQIGQHEVKAEKNIPISLERGRTGVFDLDELLLLLDELGAENVVSFPVPAEAKFCDHMVVVSAKSRRHLQAINEEMLYIHKRKKSADDSHLVIEGLHKSNWCAMDLGNIVLHVFYGQLREYYDIESLWTLGPENDPKCQDVDKDPYALSAEDLFWLEAAKSQGDKGANANTNTTDHKNLQSQREAPSSPPCVSDSDAGWGNRPS